MLVGDLIKIMRERNGLSQAELADRVGVSQQAIQQWEKNRTGPKRSVVPRLAQALGINPNQLDPLLGETVRILEPIAERHEVPLYDLSELAGIALNSAGQWIFPPISKRLSVADDLKHTFGVAISDDLMAPEYLPGDVLILDPSLAPQHLDDVVMSVGGSAPVLRRYSYRGVNKAGRSVYDLITPNAEAATLTVADGEAALLGVVIECRRRKRR